MSAFGNTAGGGPAAVRLSTIAKGLRATAGVGPSPGLSLKPGW